MSRCPKAEKPTQVGVRRMRRLQNFRRMPLKNFEEIPPLPHCGPRFEPGSSITGKNLSGQRFLLGSLGIYSRSCPQGKGNKGYKTGVLRRRSHPEPDKAAIDRMVEVAVGPAQDLRIIIVPRTTTQDTGSIIINRGIISGINLGKF